MAKKVKSVEVSKKRAQARARAIGHLVLAFAFVGLCGAGTYVARSYVERGVVTPPTPPKVVLVDAPAWMNDELRDRLAQQATPVTARSSLDASQVRDVAAILAADAWVKNVRQVRRVYGDKPGDTIEVEADYRAPVALVQDEGWFWMVDAEGIKLPERFAKHELSRVAVGRGLEKVQLRIITGVHQAAPQAGEVWQGKDLVAGLELARLFHDKPYLNDVQMIDVSNIDAQSAGAVGLKNEVVLYTRFGTQVRWGEPIQRGPFSVDVPVAQKLQTLEKLYQQYGRVDAGRPWIEIRYDRVLYPSESESQTAGTQ
jgi:hypothetical protein